MLVENQTTDVKITRRNINIYKSSGYSNAALGEMLTIRVEDLTRGSHTKVKVKCDYCGEIVDVAFKDYVHYKFDKYSCKNCRQAKTSEYNLKQRQEDLYNRALAFCNSQGYTLITRKEEILNSSTSAVYICPKHGMHETKIYTLICKHGCSDCAYEENAASRALSGDEVQATFIRFGYKLINKEDYTGWGDKNLKVVCPNCEKIFTTSYGSFFHRNGQRCPDCSRAESSGERAVRCFLEANNISYIPQYRFEDCRDKSTLPFDFYLNEQNILIEYDGEGHYIPIKRGSMSLDDAVECLYGVKRRDSIKDSYCIIHNIKLIRIPYWDYQNIETILTQQLELHEDIV